MTPLHARTNSPKRLILGLCLSLMSSMQPVFTFSALLPQFQEAWGLTSTEAGWISGVYFAGYAVSVALLTSLTDRMDARRVCQFGALVGVVSACGFALWAEGFWSAMLFRSLGGISLAGTYMPGLKALTDRLEPGTTVTRATAFYTSSFGVGSALSFLAAGTVNAHVGWEAAFVVASTGGLVAFGIVTWLLLPLPPPAQQTDRNFLDPRPVLKNRDSVGYIICYLVHNYELFGFRSWMVAFLTFTALQNGGEAFSPTLLSALVVVLGMPASVTGNELSLRFGRQRVVIAIMLTSALISFGVALSALHSVLVAFLALAVYGVFVMGDSSSITAGALQSAPPELRGITLATYSSLGFIGSFMGPVGFGWVLDQFSGGKELLDWVMAFGSMGVILLFGPLSLLLIRRGSPTR